MGRFLKIAVYIAVLFLGYLWIATVAKSCNKSTADSDTTTEQVDGIAAEDEFADEFFEDEFDATDNDQSLDEMGGGSIANGSSDIIESDPIDYTEVDDIIEENKPVATTKRTTTNTTYNSTSNTSTNSNASSRSGKYLLLAGSYLIEDNARTMVQKLKKMGYADAEVVVFDMSQYHSVCAGRYSSHSSANQESGALKRKGVDNYVHTRQ